MICSKNVSAKWAFFLEGFLRLVIMSNQNGKRKKTMSSKHITQSRAKVLAKTFPWSCSLAYFFLAKETLYLGGLMQFTVASSVRLKVKETGVLINTLMGWNHIIRELLFNLTCNETTNA